MLPLRDFSAGLSETGSGEGSSRWSNADKEKAVKAALLHPKGAGLSDTSIAEHVGVSPTFVGKHRKGLEESGSLSTVDSRQGRDGRTIDTTNIGGPAREPDDEYEADPEDEDEDEEEYEEEEREEEEGDICPCWPPMVLVCTLFACSLAKRSKSALQLCASCVPWPLDGFRYLRQLRASESKQGGASCYRTGRLDHHGPYAQFSVGRRIVELKIKQPIHGSQLVVAGASDNIVIRGTDADRIVGAGESM